jgi:EAL domain-containing protein (putative c-di-GMP-specific phosphodiesterase class I)
MPDTFLSVAEESNLIHELDYYVMKQSLSDIAYWYSIGLNPGILSLNLSIKQLVHQNFLATLFKYIKKTSFQYSWLEFEITETQVMSDPIKSIEILKKMSDLGIKISIDDFGTGYSSLAYLKRLPVHKIKIDRSFIKDLPDDEEDRAITQAIIALAKSLKLEVIAEGVENKEQIDYLKEHECYYIQGFYYSKAISKDAMQKYLNSEYAIEITKAV